MILLYRLLLSGCLVFAGHEPDDPKDRPEIEQRCRVYRERFNWTGKFDLPPPPLGEEKEEEPKSKMEMPGHSPRGEGFDSGPRQLGGLRKGMAKIQFPVTSENAEAKKFFEQGVSQLHGYQFLEAERSFRQALRLDPDLAMGYWGMALAANGIGIVPKARARALIEEAVKAKDRLRKTGKISDREVAWIEALNQLNQGKPEQAVPQYLSAMSKLTAAYPKDVEAQAFYAHGLLITPPAPETPEALVWKLKTSEAIERTLKLQPDHPAHHYKIHLWDLQKDPQKSLESATEVGPSAPGIPHMWHMATHVYSWLDKDREAAWHEEAALRLDHAYMAETGVLPNEIHNYTHNVQLFADRLWSLGRGRQAYEVVRSFLETPTDPNSPTSMGSTILEEMADGLIYALAQAEMWDEILALRNSSYFQIQKSVAVEIDFLRILARAATATGDRRLFAQQKSALACLESLAKENKYEAADRSLDLAKAEIEFLAVRASGDLVKTKAAYPVLRDRVLEKSDEGEKSAIGWPLLARYAVDSGHGAEGLSYFRKARADRQGYFTIHVGEVEALAASGKTEEARKALVQLRERFGVPEGREADLPAAKRLTAVADRLGESPAARGRPLWTDKKHPPLASFGPLTWKPLMSPALSAADETGKPYGLKKGRPTVLVFNLGKGCVHCNQQLQLLAKEGSSLTDQGVDIVVVTNETKEKLTRSLADFKKEGITFPFPVVGDPALTSFKRFGAFDEVDSQPLHGVFLLDAEGRIRWRDVGADPYLNLYVLRTESARLAPYKPVLRR